MLTGRDYEVVEFVTDFRAAKTSVIEQLFFPSRRVANRRLEQIIEDGALKRERDPDSGEYVYFVKRSKQLRHEMILTDIYALYKRNTDVRLFSIEPSLGTIRPDAVIVYIDKGIEHKACIEVELSHKGLDLEKYIRWRDSGEYRQYIDPFPLLIIVTDAKVPLTTLDVMIMPTRV